MIDFKDTASLLRFLHEHEVTVTIEACGHKRTFKESTCSKRVSAGNQLEELNYLLAKRMVELAREILHARGELTLP